MFIYHKEEFIDHFKAFLSDLEPRYVDYFISLCAEYAPRLSAEDARAMGLSLYRNLSQDAFVLDEHFRDQLIQMRNEGVMTGFMVNRNVFFILESYHTYVKEEELNSQIDRVIMELSRFMHALEDAISLKINKSAHPVESQFNSPKAANNVIIEGLQMLKEAGGKVQFYNLYQGIPISCHAEIISIQDDSATFKLDLLQEIAMKLDGQAFILKNDVFTKHIKADIVYSNFLTKTVMLENFTYLLNMPALERATPRIHPDIAAQVYLHPEGKLTTIGRLFDLSVNGLGVLSSENNGIEIGTRLSVRFSLPSKGEIDVSATVVNIITYQAGFRFCMRIFPNEQTKEKLEVYTKQREKDIIQNLEDELKDYIF